MNWQLDHHASRSLAITAVRRSMAITVVTIVACGGSAAASEGVLISSIFEAHRDTRIGSNVRINDSGVVGFYTESFPSGDPSYRVRVLRYENGSLLTVGGHAQGSYAPGHIYYINNVHLNDNGLFVVDGVRINEIFPAGIVDDSYAIWSGTESLDLVYNAHDYDLESNEIFQLSVLEVDNSGRIYGIGDRPSSPRYALYEFSSGTPVPVLSDEQVLESSSDPVFGPNDSGRAYYADPQLFMGVPRYGLILDDQLNDGALGSPLFSIGDPFDGGAFAGFGGGSNVTTDGRLAFQASVERDDSFSAGIYVTDGTTTSKLFDVVTAATPDAPMASVESLTINDNGLVAFAAEATDPALPGRALYATTDGIQMTRVVGVGDPLLGSFIDGIHTFDMNNHNRVAFYARLADGRSVVALARLSDEIHWTISGGGLWSEGDNWLPGEPPIEEDTAVFDLAGAYTVSLDEPAQVAGVRVGQGDVTFDLAGHSMQIGSLSVGEADGQQAIMRVSDVDGFNAQSIVVGAVANSESALVLGPDTGNPFGATADEMAHGSGGTGAFLPNTALSCNSHSRVVIQNAALEFSSISASASGPVPVPFPNIASESDRILIKNSSVQISGDLTVGDNTHFIGVNGDAAGVATSLVSAVVTSDRATIWSAINLSQSATLSSREIRVNSVSTSSEEPPVLLSINTNSTLETLAGGSAVVGEQGAAAIDVSSGSTFEATGADVTIGASGNGTLSVTGQSNMAADTLTLGLHDGSAGNVTVSSVTGTSTIQSPQISVAVAGSGVLRVSNGGEVVSDTVDVSVTEDDEPPPDTGAGAGMLDGIGQLIVTGTGRVIAEEVNIGPLGELQGDGVIDVDDGVTNGGKVKPGASPGTLTIIGPYTQTDTGELEIEISGAGDDEFDLLSIEGAATIDGTVTFQFIDGFAPQQGQQFQFLTVDGLADLSDASFEVRNLAAGFMFDITPSAEGILMTALNDGVFAPDTTPGDSNSDGVVDAADYVVWRKTDGSPEDYETWRANFGRSAGSADSLADTSVPEPRGMALLAILLCTMVAPRLTALDSRSATLNLR